MDVKNWVVVLALKWLIARVVWLITSKHSVRAKRWIADVFRVRKRGQVELFVCLSDPHSLLALQACRKLLDEYPMLRLEVRAVREPIEEGFAAYGTEAEIQVKWREKDANALVSAYPNVLGKGLPEGWDWRRPSPDLVKRGSALFISLIGQHTIDSTTRGRELLDKALDIACAIMTGNEKVIQNKETTVVLMGAELVEHELDVNKRALGKGHYLSAMFRYGFEWFWGVDRLEYLEEALLEQKKETNRQAPFFTRTRKLKLLASLAGAGSELAPITLFYSFRSPYSQVVLKPLYEMADHYGLKVHIRPVLPMVMRGLQVPTNKKLYIISDTARVARQHGWNQYGRLNDPVGKPTENAFACYMHAIRQGREREFLFSWANHVYARGKDSYTAGGMREICSAAGMENFQDEWINSENWRDFENENREALLAQGLWGVPSMQFNNVSVWGQDRLMEIERHIILTLEAKS